MKKLLSKKLSACLPVSIAFIVTAMMFSASLSAQSITPISNLQPSSVINCHCTIFGGFSGCGTNSACKLYCSYYCRLHRHVAENDEPGLNDATTSTDMSLEPAPNSINISFFISQPGNVSLQIYDMTGRLVTTLADNSFQKGEHSLVWNNVKDNENILTPGMYSLRMNAEEAFETEKFIVMN